MARDLDKEIGAGAIELVSMRRISGCIFGLGAPSLLARLRIDEPVLAEAVYSRCAAAFSTRFAVRTAVVSGPDRLFAGMTELVAVVLDQGGHPVPPGHGAAPVENGVAFALPVYSHAAVASALTFVLGEMGRFSVAPERKTFDDGFEARFEQLMDRLLNTVPFGSNARNMIQAGYDLNLPFLALPGQLLQFGWGEKARRFVSSSSEETGTIGMNLSRRKDHTSALLRAAGLPVADQRLVRSLDQAREAAEDLGFPVVLKALDNDQGRGVFPGLSDVAALSRVWDAVADLSAHIAVERHIAGQDYRINVVDGVVVGAVLRVPAAVLGDGVRDVRALIDAENEDPRRSFNSFSSMKPIVVDDEARELLAEQNIALDDVPEAGQQIRLRRTANVSTGGTSTIVLDQVHPENAGLAVLAAQQLGLDISGVDLILPDISVPWKVEDSVICEVNGRPQIGLNFKNIFRDILAARVSGDGRVPVVLVLDGEKETRICEAVADQLGDPEGLGLCSAATLSVGRRRLCLPSGVAGRDLRALLLSREVKNILLCTTAEEIASQGSPVDRYAAIAVLPGAEAVPGFDRAIGHLAPFGTGRFLTLEGTGAWEALDQLGVPVRAVADRGELTGHLASVLSASGR